MSGQFTCRYLYDAEMRQPSPTQGPPGTRSQVLRLTDDCGQWVAEVHQYVRPDRSLGASGKPDPKRLQIGGVVYAIKPKRLGGSYMDDAKSYARDSVEALKTIRRIASVSDGPLTVGVLDAKVNALLGSGWMLLAIYKSSIDAEGETLTLVFGHSDPAADPSTALPGQCTAHSQPS